MATEFSVVENEFSERIPFALVSNAVVISVIDFSSQDFFVWAKLNELLVEKPGVQILAMHFDVANEIREENPNAWTLGFGFYSSALQTPTAV
jgi:hypothetical protein